MNELLRRPACQVIELLVKGKYAEIETLTRGSRLNAQEMANAIRDYGRQLIAPPDDAFRLIEAIEIRNSQPRRWSIVVPLWTLEEGRSDLSLEMTVTTGECGLTIEVDDIHVL